MNAGVIEIDLHGKNAYQAKTAIEAALRRAGAGTYRLRVVHGYNGGTRLRDVARLDFAAHPKVKRVVPAGEGVTELVLREF